MFTLVFGGTDKSCEQRVCYENTGQSGCRWEDVISLFKYSEKMWTEYVWLRIRKMGSVLLLLV